MSNVTSATFNGLVEGTLSPNPLAVTIRWTKRSGLTPRPKGKGQRLPTVAQLNKWFGENYVQIAALAQQNAVSLTGKRHL